MTPYASWKKAKKVKRLLLAWLAVICLLPICTSTIFAQSPFASSKQSLLLSNAQAGASERWAAIFFPSSATANYRLILPGTAPTSGQFLSIASISGNDATLQWSNVASSLWSLTGNAGLTDGTNNLLGTTDNIPVRVLTNNVERMRILGNGNVGIGTATPTSLLSISSTNDVSLAVAGSGILTVGPSASANIAIDQNEIQARNNTSSATLNLQNQGGNIQVHLSSTPGTNFSILDNGNVGLGTSTPIQRLDIRGGNIRLDTSALNTPGQLQFINPARTFQTNIQAGAQTANITYTLPLALPTNNGVLQSTSGGVMSWADLGAGQSLVTTAGGTATRVAFWNGATSLSSNADLFWDNTNSRLGIGTATPTASLDVANTARIGLTSATTPQLIIDGGAGGADLVRLRRTSGVTTEFGWSLNAGLMSFTDVTNSQVQIQMGGTTPTLTIGSNNGATSSAGGFASILQGSTSGTAAPNLATGDFTIRGGISSGNATPSRLVFATTAVGTSGTTLQSFANRMVIDGNGNVGIGTMTPNTALQFGNVISNRRIVLWEDNNNDHQFYGIGINSGILRFQTVGGFTFNVASSSSTSNEIMRVLGNGTVGIGIIAPTSRLHLDGGTAANSYLTFTNGTTTGQLGSDGFVVGSGSDATATLWNREVTGMIFATSNAERMRITATGDLGIGLTTPTSKVHIDNGTGATSYLTFTNGTTTGQAVTDGFVIGTNTSAEPLIWNREGTAIRFATSDAERMRITPSGAVGIGTASPSAGFHYNRDNSIITSSAGQTPNVSNFLLLGNLNNASYHLRIQEPNGSGSNYNALLSPVQAYDMRYTFPSVIPTVNQVLSASVIVGNSSAGYDISLQWVDNTLSGGGGTVTGSGVVGEVAFWTTTSQLSSDPRLYWDDGLLRLGVGTNTPDEKLDVEGHLLISNGNSLANQLRIAEPFYTTGNLNYTGFTTQAQVGNLIYTLPGAGPANSAFGTNRFVMATNFAGSTATLGWETFWSPQGNAGTDPANAFIGTTDNQPLAFRTNNTEQMRIVNSQLQLRSGNSSGAFTNNQLVMGWNGASDYQFMHSIKTRHNSGGVTENAIDFYLWRQGTDAATASPTLHGLTIEGASGATSNIGIGGVTSPRANLHLPNVVGNRRAILFSDADNDHQFYGFGINSGVLRHQIANTSASHAFFAATSGTASNELMRIQGNGNVGIGTSSPSARLEVFGSGAGNIDLVVNGRIRTGDASGNGGVWLSTSFDGFVGNNGGNIGFFTSGASWNAFQIVKASGNVGIGTQSPTTRLQVNGTSRFVGGSMLIDTVSNGTAGQIQLMNPARTFQTNIQAGAQTANITYTLPTVAPTAGQVLSSDASGNMSWVASSASMPLSSINAATATNSINSSNFGQTWQWNTLAGISALTLSTTSTAATGNAQTLLNLSMSGANATSTQTTYGAQISNTHTGTSSTNVGLSVSASGGTNNYALLVPNGNVGIKTINPTQDLEVAGTVFVNAENSAFTVDALTNSRLGLVKKSGLDPVIAAGSGTNLSLGHWSTSNINGNIGSGTFNERVRITTTGNVGIGTTTPTSLLHVNGSTRISGGNVLVDTASSGTAGQVQLMNPARTFQTNIRAGAQTANITYTLPTASPSANGQVLSATTGGVMSWADPATIVAGTQFLRKTADEFLSSNATLQNDDHLTFSIPANQSYELEIVMHVTTDNATNGGIQFTVTSPAGSTVFLSTSTATTVPLGENVITTSGATDNIATLNATRNKVVLKGYILNSSTAGSVTVQWAQQTSSTGEVRVRSGSYMKVTRIQ